MDSRKEQSTKLMQQMLDNGGLGPITPAMRRLQDKYLSGRMEQYDFMLACDAEVKKIDREKDERKQN